MAKVLIIGNDARAHAIGWRLAQDEEVTEVIYADGTPGTHYELKGKNIRFNGLPENFRGIASYIATRSIDMVVVSPEQPLADGIVDKVYESGFTRVIGCTQAASALEADKFFSHDVNDELGIPQAYSIKCHSIREARGAIEEVARRSEGIVIKARRLAKGKSVLVCDNKKEALEQIIGHIARYGSDVLIAERLYGDELTIFGLSDGNKVIPFEMTFRDYKKLNDGDIGPNTGGMGAICPVPNVPLDIVHYVADKIMTPVVTWMKKEKDIDYKGIMYAGLMVTKKDPRKLKHGLKILEYNVRLGDPEWEPGALMIDGSLYKIFSDSLDGKLKSVKFKQGAACAIVLASKGYPGYDYKRNLLISGLNEVDDLEGVKVFHAGTKFRGKAQGRISQIATASGRVLVVTAYSPLGLPAARDLGYEVASKINIPGGFHYRRDIGRIK